MFLLFAETFLLLFSAVYPLLSVEIRVWIFSSRLPASDCRKEKKRRKKTQPGNGESLARCNCCVYCLGYFILVLLYSSRDEMMMLSVPVCECTPDCCALQLIVVFILSFSHRRCVGFTCFIMYSCFPSLVEAFSFQFFPFFHISTLVYVK